MAPRKAFPLRLEPALYDELQRWASAELRSLNGQIEYLLRRALQDAGRTVSDDAGRMPSNQEDADANQQEDPQGT